MTSLAGLLAGRGLSGTVHYGTNCTAAKETVSAIEVAAGQAAREPFERLLAVNTVAPGAIDTDMHRGQLVGEAHTWLESLSPSAGWARRTMSPTRRPIPRRARVLGGRLPPHRKESSWGVRHRCRLIPSSPSG